MVQEARSFKNTSRSVDCFIRLNVLSKQYLRWSRYFDISPPEGTLKLKILEMADSPMITSSSDEQFGPSDEETGGTITMTPYEVLHSLTKAWLNEKMAPDLLEPLSGEVEILLEQISNEEVKMSQLTPRDEMFRHLQMEVERVRFLIVSYLRTRLAKIQKYSWKIRDEENKRHVGSPSKLMPEELKFLREYIQVVEGHLKTVALVNMPQGVQGLKPDKMMVTPNLDSFVFVRVNKPTTINIDDAEGRTNQEVSLQPGVQLITKYRPLSGAIAKKDVQLV